MSEVRLQVSFLFEQTFSIINMYSFYNQNIFRRIVVKWVPDMALDVSSSVRHDGKVKYFQSQALG